MLPFLTTVRAEAHCDIPCGIYDPTPAKIAAKTVARMIDQLAELAPPSPDDRTASAAYLASAARRIAVKEKHAEDCKRELSILWSDFFKPEHLPLCPDLHDKVWKTLKLASKCKQSSEREDAAALVTAVDDIAEAFYAAKGAPERFDAYRKITDNLY